MYSLVGDASVARLGLNDRERRKGATNRVEEESLMEALTWKRFVSKLLTLSFHYLYSNYSNDFCSAGINHQVELTWAP